MTVIDDIKSRLDITEMVSRYVTLQRSGSNQKANCPFHQERTPSFYVFPDRQTWRCFGACATGGDVFTFVMKAENLEFRETLERLAQQTGVSLPRRQERVEQQTATDVNEAANQFFQRLLASEQGAAARAYLERRGVSKEAVANFELGLSPPDGRSLGDHLRQHGFPSQALEQAGLVRTTDNGRQRDFFRGRLMFPIRNGQGELGGFGARALDNSQPKYLNTSRSPVFDKGRILYAMHRAKDTARKQGIVIVEGYMDTIAAHEAGFTNVVASMGTALTEHQVGEVQRISRDVTMALDADAAGQQATLRSLESSWKVIQSQVAGRTRGTTLFQRPEMAGLKIAVMPEGEDPDDLIRRSPDEWRDLIESGTPLVEYLIDALAKQYDVYTPQGKTQLVEAVLPSVYAVATGFEQDQYFQMLADKLGVTREALLSNIDRPAVPRRPTRQPRARQNPAAHEFSNVDGDPLDEFCLSLLLRHPELETEVVELRPEYFHRPENREIYSQWLSARTRGDVQPVESIRGSIGEELQEYLEKLVGKEHPEIELLSRPKAIRDCVTNMRDRYLRDLKREEETRFTDTETDLEEDTFSGVLEVNQRIKENQDARDTTVKVRTY